MCLAPSFSHLGAGGRAGEGSDCQVGGRLSPVALSTLCGALPPPLVGWSAETRITRARPLQIVLLPYSEGKCGLLFPISLERKLIYADGCEICCTHFTYSTVTEHRGEE